MSGAETPLRQALGSQALLCGYPLAASRRWMVGDELVAQSCSAESLCVAEDLPVLCGYLAASPLALDVLAEAGWRLPERLLVFRDTQELLALVLEEAAAGRRLANSYPFPDSSIPPRAHLVDPRLRAMLNDKANLEQLVPAGLHPVRRHVEAAAVLREPTLCRSAVLKIAGDESGGGMGVLLPPDSADPELVKALLQGAETAIVEEFLPLIRSCCFNYLIDGQGSVRFLGAPEQFLLDGRYLGNWFLAGDRPAPEAVAAGVAICQQAAALGYRGAAGFDAGFLADGSFRFFDLNFRMNGSTAPLLLVSDLLRRCGAAAALRTGLRGRTSPRALASRLRRLLSESRLFPLAVVLADADAAETDFLVSGFLTGASEADILTSASALTRQLLGRTGTSATSGKIANRSGQ